jgi:hypothetical protein
MLTCRGPGVVLGIGVKSPAPSASLRAGSVAESATRTGQPLGVEMSERVGQPPQFKVAKGGEMIP